MRTDDLIAFGVAAMRRQKLRTLLTLLGVAIGTATLVISVAIGLGVRATIDEQFRKEENLRQITVFPSNEGFSDELKGVPDEILDIQGEMSRDKRDRIRKLHANRWKRSHTQAVPKPLTKERVEELARIPHVVDVIPELDEYGRAFFSGQSSDAHILGVPADYKLFDHRLEVGGSFSEPGAKECIVHEYLLYRWGIRDDAAVRAAVGKTVRVELTTSRRPSLNLLSLFEADLSNVSEEELRVLEKAWKLLPQSFESLPLSLKEKEVLRNALRRKSPVAKKPVEKTIAETFAIVGVIRAPVKGDPPDKGFLDGPLRDAEVIVPRRAAEEFFMQLPRREENGYRNVRLIVDTEDNLEGVVDEVKKMGLNEISMGLFIQQVRRNVLLIGFSMDFIAIVALIVAAIGITNTMFTTVLERTREIGIMKAIGAKDRQILTMFLIEGSLIGLLGGLCGLLVGWLASFPGNDYALRLMAKQGHKPMPETVFLYPIWLLVAVPIFSILMTTTAALLPARRAAKVEPVVALRHE